MVFLSIVIGSLDLAVLSPGQLFSGRGPSTEGEADTLVICTGMMRRPLIWSPSIWQVQALFSRSIVQPQRSSVQATSPKPLPLEPPDTTLTIHHIGAAECIQQAIPHRDYAIYTIDSQVG